MGGSVTGPEGTTGNTLQNVTAVCSQLVVLGQFIVLYDATLLLHEL